MSRFTLVAIIVIGAAVFPAANSNAQPDCYTVDTRTATVGLAPDECVNRVGELPLCTILEQIADVDCSTAAAEMGLDYNVASRATGILAAAGDIHVTYEDLDTGVVPPPALTSAQTTEVAATSPDEFGNRRNLNYQGTRYCFYGHHRTDVSGINNRYRGAVPDGTRYKWVVWAQKTTGEGVRSHDIRLVAHNVKTKVGALIDYDPWTTTTTYNGQTIGVYVEAEVKAVKFGFDATFPIASDRFGGRGRPQRDGIGGMHYSFWEGNSGYPQGIIGSTIWQLKKQQVGDFAIQCAGWSH